MNAIPALYNSHAFPLGNIPPHLISSDSAKEQGREIVFNDVMCSSTLKVKANSQIATFDNFLPCGTFSAPSRQLHVNVPTFNHVKYFNNFKIKFAFLNFYSDFLRRKGSTKYLH